jgi:hypothetical protein
MIVAGNLQLSYGRAPAALSALFASKMKLACAVENLMPPRQVSGCALEQCCSKGNALEVIDSIARTAESAQLIGVVMLLRPD